MTTERQRRANRANAQKSTGPRTAAGKARASRNAVTHGLTTTPDARSVDIWNRIIHENPAVPLENPAIPLDAFAASARDKAAFRLAMAEARRARAAAAEIEHLKRMTEQAKPKTLDEHLKAKEIDLEDPDIPEHLIARTTDPVAIEGLEVLLDHCKVKRGDDLQRLRQVTRHRRSAEAQCRKALKAWLNKN